MMIKKSYKIDKSYQVRVQPVQIEVGENSSSYLQGEKWKKFPNAFDHVETSTEGVFNHSAASPRAFVLNTENQQQKVTNISFIKSKCYTYIHTYK